MTTDVTNKRLSAPQRAGNHAANHRPLDFQTYLALKRAWLAGYKAGRAAT